MITAFLDWSLLDGMFVRSALLAAVGFPLLLLLSRLVRRVASRNLTTHHAFVASKLTFYLGAVLLIVTILLNLQFNLTAILGTAGIATVAVSFAAQTSLSNLISGLFLLGEKPFAVGDMIVVDGTRGLVLSIDLLSIKLRTLDNLYLRIPNERLIRDVVTNVSRFPIRRMDIDVSVAYKEDLRKVMRILQEVADRNVDSLDEPAPLIMIKDFGSSSINFLFGVWFEKTKFLQLKNSLMIEIKEAFDREGIEIPFPHLSLYTGSETAPFPLSLADMPGSPGGTAPEAPRQSAG